MTELAQRADSVKSIISFSFLFSFSLQFILYGQVELWFVDMNIPNVNGKDTRKYKQMDNANYRFNTVFKLVSVYTIDQTEKNGGIFFFNF